MNDDSKLHWLVRPETIRQLWRWGISLLLLLTLGDLVIHGHTYFAVDGTFAFYSWYGLLTCAVMVLFAKGLGAFIGRRDTFYDD